MYWFRNNFHQQKQSLPHNQQVDKPRLDKPRLDQIGMGVNRIKFIQNRIKESTDFLHVLMPVRCATSQTHRSERVDRSEFMVLSRPETKPKLVSQLRQPPGSAPREQARQLLRRKATAVRDQSLQNQMKIDKENAQAMLQNMLHRRRVEQQKMEGRAKRDKFLRAKLDKVSTWKGERREQTRREEADQEAKVEELERRVLVAEKIKQMLLARGIGSG